MFGLSGIGWMFVSLTFGYVVHEIMQAMATVAGEDFALGKSKWTTLMFSLSGIPMLIYPVIGMFLGPKWYIAPMFALASFLISGKVLYWTTGLAFRNPNTLIKVIYPVYAFIQFASAILAFIAWF